MCLRAAARGCAARHGGAGLHCQRLHFQTRQCQVKWRRRAARGCGASGRGGEVSQAEALQQISSPYATPRRAERCPCQTLGARRRPVAPGRRKGVGTRTRGASNGAQPSRQAQPSSSAPIPFYKLRQPFSKFAGGLCAHGPNARAGKRGLSLHRQNGHVTKHHAGNSARLPSRARDSGNMPS